jgi:hypothetical protein
LLATIADANLNLVALLETVEAAEAVGTIAAYFF